MTLQDRILRILDRDFQYQDTDWIRASELITKLRRASGALTLKDIDRELRNLSKRQLVDYSPTLSGSELIGFTTRLTARGHNQVHYGRPSLV